MGIVKLHPCVAVAVGRGAARCGAVRCGGVRWGAVRCGGVRWGAVRCGAHLRVGFGVILIHILEEVWERGDELPRRSAQFAVWRDRGQMGGEMMKKIDSVDLSLVMRIRREVLVQSLHEPLPLRHIRAFGPKIGII